MAKDQRPYIGELFERHKRELMSYLTRRAGREAAADLLQETYARVLHRGLIDNIADPPAYLRQTAANLATDFTRRRTQEFKFRVFDDGSLDTATEELTPEASLENSQRSRTLAGAMESLPPKCRQVFAMRMHEGLSHDEIGRRLGISRKMVERHLRIAIQRCRAAVK